MAGSTSLPRRALRAALVLVVTGAALGLVPLRPGAAAPETVLRAVPVEARSLIPRTEGPAVALAPDGAVRAATAARTARVPVCSPIWFDGVALTWDQAAGPAVSATVTTSADGRSYGRGVFVDAEGGADPGTPEYRASRQGSSYLWTGGSRCVRFSMAFPKGARVSNVRVLFINSSGTAAGPGTGPKDAGPVAVGTPAGPFAPSPAEALTRRPRIITRDQWGADPVLMNCTPLVADVLKMGFVHHTAGTNSYTRDQADDVVRGVYAYHTNGRGWCDIGYNFLVDRFGDVFEGRSGGVTSNVIGAAQMGFNTGAFSVSVMGNFDAAPPPEAALRVLERVLAWRLDVGHVNPAARTVMVSAGGDTTKYAAGAAVRLRTISGHRDTGITACPGRFLYALLPRIRSNVAAMGLPKSYKPNLSTTSIVIGQPADVRIQATGSTSMTWTVTILDPAGSVFATFPTLGGEAMDVLWPAGDPTAQPTVLGDYQVVISATHAEGAIARPASLTLSVLPVPPPSPSPTPSASPSPTVSPSTSPSP